MELRKIDDKDFIGAIIKSRGIVKAVAEELGVDRQTVLRHLEANPVLQALLDYMSEDFLDQAEMILYDKVLKGDNWALSTLLYNKGRNRGYGKRDKEEKAVEEVVVFK